MNETAGKRLLILCTTTGYQTAAFVEAASKAGMQVVFGSDRCHVLEDPWQDGAIALRFEDPDEAAERIAQFARRTPIHALVALGDGPARTAAGACQRLGLPGHTPEAAELCQNKYRSRTRLAEAGLKVPRFARFRLEDDPREMVAPGSENGLAAGGIGFPCVLKPLALSASRGVIRATDPTEFVSAFERIRRLLAAPGVQVRREGTSHFIQVETYVDGVEVAVEAMVEHGTLWPLAIFDKPDPLTGPYFEETIYVTPSRLPAETQESVIQTLEHAVRALGLSHGPAHAEFRITTQGVWTLEVAARSIGGLCSRALRFQAGGLETKLSLEDVLVRLSLGVSLQGLRREEQASGVMMIPVPGEGILETVQGVKEARNVDGIEDVVITAKSGERLVPWPEGSSYPGFIFACAPTVERVEAALRQAHGRLRFNLARTLPVMSER